MSRVSRSRVAVTTGLALATAAAGLALGVPTASAAPAPLPAPVVTPSTLVAGQPFTITLSGCFDDRGGDSLAGAWYVTDDPDAPLGNGGQVPAGGEITFEEPHGFWSAPVGTYQLLATCDHYHTRQAYPPVTITVVAPGTDVTRAAAGSTMATSGTAAPAPVAPVGAVRGAAANTSGISTTSSSVSASAVVPGKQVTRVLTGFQPGEVVTVVMHSTPTTLGTFTADANGVVTATYTIPAGTAAANHTFVYEGNMGSYFQETLPVGSGTAAASASSGLAYTGADVAVPLTIGGGLVLAGGGALLLTRRRDAGAAQT